MSSGNENAFYIEIPRYRSNSSWILDLIALKPVAIGTITAPLYQPDCGIAIGQYAGYWDQGECAIAIGRYAGHTSQGADAIGIGTESAKFLQGDYAVALGAQAGKTHQYPNSIAIGHYAGQFTQGESAVAIGNSAGNYSQGMFAVAIGTGAGLSYQHANSLILNATGNTLNSQTQSAWYVAPVRSGSSGQVLYYNTVSKEILSGGVPSGNIPSGTYHGDYLHWDSDLASWSLGTMNISLGSFAGEDQQGDAAVALGFHSGEYNQGSHTVAIGEHAGQYSQGQYAIAMGYSAGKTQQPANSIVLNASGTPLTPGQSSSLYVDPIRQDATSNVLFYNSSSKEIVWESVSEHILPDGDQYSDYLFWDSSTSEWQVGSYAIHLGARAGFSGQVSGAIALGIDAGKTNQSANSIAIGTQSGMSQQGANAIAIGAQAGMNTQHANSIIFNASGNVLNSQQSNAWYVDPIRNATGPQVLCYQPSTKEITYSDPTLSNLSLQTYTYSYFQARDAVAGKFMLTDCADKDAFYRLRVSNPQTIFEGSTVYNSNPLSFDNDISSAQASITGPVDAAMTLALSSSSIVNDYAARQTHFYAHYQPGKSFMAMFSFCFGAPATGIVKRAGFYDVDNVNNNNPLNGIVFEQTQTGGYQWSVYKGDGITVQNAPRASWNVDPLDGSGPSGVILSPTTNLLAFVDLEWLGVGRVRVGFYINGVPVICHTFNNAGLSSPYMTSPLLPIRYEIRKTIAGSVSGSMNIVCCSIMSEGGFQPIGVVRSFHSPTLRLSGSSPAVTTIGSCIGFRLKASYPRAILQPINVEIVSDLNGNAVAYYSVYLWRPSSSLTPSGLVWVSVSNESFVEYNTTLGGVPYASDLYRQMIADTSGISIQIEQGTVSTVTKTSFASVVNNLLIAQSGVIKTNRDIIVIVVDNTSVGPTPSNYSAILTWREY